MNFDRHAFWKNPAGAPYPAAWVEHCKPEFYLGLENVTRLIVETVTRYAKPSWSILELGCGTGRNLAGLYRAGFKKLSGVEINETAVALGRENFPELEHVKIEIAAIEEVFESLPRYDLIFTSGVLMHLPYDLEWIIAGLRDKARKMILVNEGERAESFHAWRHDYAGIIPATGEWNMVEWHTGENYPPLPKTTIKRVFLREVKNG